MLKHKILSLLTVILFSLSLNAASLPARAQSHIVDQANLFSHAEEKKITSLLKQLYQKADADMHILTIPSLDGESIEGYSIRLADKWAPGTREKDNGLIFIIAIKERKTRIEVGQGLEGFITDARAGDMLRALKPYFRSSRFYDGTAVTIQNCAKAINGSSLGVQVAQATVQQTNRSKDSPLGKIIIFLIFAVIIYLNMTGRGGGFYISSGGSSWGGSSSGGGGFGGSGGGFSGGGSSGSW